MTLQWRFQDATPWRVRIADGSARAEPGLDPDADLVIRCRYDDWCDVIEAWALASRLRDGERRDYPEATPLVADAPDGEGTAERMDDLTTDGEPQPGAFLLGAGVSPTCRNRSKITSAYPGGIPVPVSCSSMSARHRSSQ